LGNEAEPLTIAASTQVTVLVCPYAALLSELRPDTLQTVGSTWRPHAEQRQQRVAQEAARLMAQSQSHAESVASSAASTPREEREASSTATVGPNPDPNLSPGGGRAAVPTLGG